MIIGVIGAGSCDKEIYSDAERIGYWIGSNGHILASGGLGGVMEAVARGAKRAGGVSVGILPGTDASDSNPYIDIPVVTGMGHARNAILTGTADILVAVSGELGTLSEIAMGLKIGRPVLAYKCQWAGIRGVVSFSEIDRLFAGLKRLGC